MSLPGTIGAYRVTGELGRGGMGVVYSAESLASPGACYAIKVLLSQDERARERLRREGALLGRIDRHPNVVRVHATGEDKGRMFLVLDLVSGGSLAALLAGGPLPWRRALELIEHSARALEAIHGLGILHRDLKPSNILIDEDGRPRITDFGIAQAEDLERLTRTGNIVGTIDYLAPELLRGADGYGPRSDIYALGACLYEALTGTRPFVATSIIELARLIEQGEVVPPSRLVKEVPKAVDRIVLRAIAHEPDARPKDAGAFADELRALRLGNRSDRRLGAGLAALVLCALAFAAFSVSWSAPAPSSAGASDPLAPAPATPRTARTGSGPTEAARAIERARAARRSENPASYTAIDDTAPLARHADQVFECLADARAKDSAIELPADLVCFILDSGLACARRRDLEGARHLLEEAVTLDPENVDARLQAAYFEQLDERPQWDRTLAHSLAVLGIARAIPPDRARAYNLAIQAAGALGEHGRARTLLESAVAEFPEDPSVLMRLFDSQLADSDPAALVTAEKLLAMKADSEYTHQERLRLKGRALRACKKDGKGALAAFREVHGPGEWTAADPFDDLVEVARCHILLHDKKAAKRVAGAARESAERNDTSRLDTVRQVEAEVGALPDR